MFSLICIRFVMPHSLIICNDIWAYFVGFFIGRKFIDKPLTRLSPNKTWEGFIGGAIATLIWGFIVRILLFLNSPAAPVTYGPMKKQISGVLADYEWFRCSYAALQTYGGCEAGPLFVPAPLGSILKVRDIFISYISNKRLFFSVVVNIHWKLCPQLFKWYSREAYSSSCTCVRFIRKLSCPVWWIPRVCYQACIPNWGAHPFTWVEGGKMLTDIAA